MATEKHIQILLDKYLNDTYTPEDYQKLLDYFGIEGNETDTEQLLYNAIISETMGAQVSQERMEKVMDNAKSRLQQRINKRPPTSIRSILPYAAAIFFIVSSAIYWFNSRVPKQVDSLTSIYGDDVLPGGNHAYITLSDGRRIELDSSKSSLTAFDNRLTYADGEEILAATGVDYATISTPIGGEYQMTLPDGTKAWLNAQSSLKYPLRFDNRERQIEIEGEVYLDVAPDKNRPFLVISGSQHIQVLGTAFNLRNYEGMPTVTTLVYGKISLVLTGSKEQVILQPGKQAILSNDNIQVSDVDPSDYTAWLDGIILNKDATLKEISQELERWYGVTVHFPKNFNNNERAVISIDRKEKLSAVLTALENTYQVQFSIAGKEVVIR